MFEEKENAAGLFVFLPQKELSKSGAKLLWILPLLHRTTSAKNRRVRVWSKCFVSPTISFFYFRVNLAALLLLVVQCSPSIDDCIGCAPHYAACATVAALGLEVLRSRHPPVSAKGLTNAICIIRIIYYMPPPKKTKPDV